MKEAIVLRDAEDERDILQNGEDLFLRLYALRKILNKKDGEELKQKVRKLMKNTKLDVYGLNILPKEWEIYYDRIKDLQSEYNKNKFVVALNNYLCSDDKHKYLTQKKTIDGKTKIVEYCTTICSFDIEVS